MSSLTKKIDFAIVVRVKNANPNGDPLNGNRPRIDYDGFGEISDVCLKRKIRDRLLDAGQTVFVQSDQKNVDGMKSLRERAESEEFGLGKAVLDSKKTPVDKAAQLACEKWFDVRAFGQLFAFKSAGKDGVSIPVRGPVTVQSGYSLAPIGITSIQITKSVSGEGDGSKKSSDTMGMKHRVDNAVYVAYGAMSPQLAERTGFTDADAAILKELLPKLFEGDASSARPEGSMAVEQVVWWEHSSKQGQYSSAKVHGSFSPNSDGELSITPLPGLEPEILQGF
ncbi:CRISPR-associated protein, Csd2 family [Teredinibacter turnerae T7901]|uniref:CRISPR-associated protein, Csd2 family n=1 Tax=Teredinibacter turnerae (strain ATCC 39867 / T7901) TaxID=377629 RepID=C5BP92_TERTT|nr:type I-C CRISPR-associated protein Cas7/Csd2 [Teredinibacter turnerae]ACR11071.1 CRISPR-associated protein, Csd2 family [Teredinibacter turnerae T7901]